MMKKFRVWFTFSTFGGYDEDYLDVTALDENQAYHNVMNANQDIHDFDVQSVEPLD